MNRYWVEAETPLQSRIGSILLSFIRVGCILYTKIFVTVVFVSLHIASSIFDNHGDNQVLRHKGSRQMR